MNNNMDVMDRVNQFVEVNANKMAANIELEKQIQWAKIMKQFADMKGTKFHAFVLNVEDDESNERPMVYMTNTMISETTGIAVDKLKFHYREESKLLELSENDGYMELKGGLLKNEVSMLASETHEHENISLLYPSSFSKSGKNNVMQYSDGSSFTLANSPNTILSLKSVMKLMLMMTQTPVAKEFRDFVLDQLAIGGVAQETAEEYFEATFDKENIIMYSNNTEKLLELLDISAKYDLMKGVVNKNVDPMKQKVRMIDARKEEFQEDINNYKNEINEYKAIDEDLFFDKIDKLQTKIEETERIIETLGTVCKTLLLRLNMISKVIKTLSSEARSTSLQVQELKPTVDKINKEYVMERKQAPAIQGVLDSKKLNSLLMNTIGLIENGIYGYTVANSTNPSKPLPGHIIASNWTKKYSKEFIKSLQSTQERTGTSSDKYIKWTPFGIKLIGLLLEEHYLNGKDINKLIESKSEEDWEKAVYDRYMEEKLAAFKNDKNNN